MIETSVLYENLNLMEYLKVRQQEKKSAKVVKAAKADPEEKYFRNYVWDHLLNNQTEYNAYQIYRGRTFLPKFHPDDVETNAAYINIREAQRRFLQYKNPDFIEGMDLQHLDLKNAYATALSDLDKSLVYLVDFEISDLEDIEKWTLNDKFYIFDLHIRLPYTPTLNLYVSNNKIFYNSKQVSETNMPPLGRIVLVKMKLQYSKKMNIRNILHFLEDIEREFIDYKITRCKVTIYDYVEREKLFTLETLENLMEKLDLLKGMQRVYAKKAIVSFTGQLMHIDPGMRLIMLSLCESVILNLRSYLLQEGAEIYGVQIDALYYTLDYFNFDQFKTQISKIILATYNRLGRQAPKKLFRIDSYTEKDYKETPFRLQEVHTRWQNEKQE